MTMLEILKERLIDGLSIASIKETNNKYKLVLEYEGDKTTVELAKTCAPTYEKETADKVIITAMSTIYLNRGDTENAKMWLDRIVNWKR